MSQPSESSIQSHSDCFVGTEKHEDLPAMSAMMNSKPLMSRDLEASMMLAAGVGGGSPIQSAQFQQPHTHLHQHQQQQVMLTSLPQPQPPPPHQHNVDNMTNFGNSRFAYNLNIVECLDANVSNGWSFQHQQQSVPLYRRQPQSSVPITSQENVSLTPVHCILDGVVDKTTSGTSGAFAGYARAAVSIGLQRDIRPTLPVNLQQREVLSQLSFSHQRELQAQLPAVIHQSELTQVPGGLRQREMSTQMQRDVSAPLSVFYPSHVHNQQQQVEGFTQQQHVQHLRQQQHLTTEFSKTNGHDESSGDDLSSTQRQNGGGTTYASVLRATPQKSNSSVSPNGQEEEKNGMGDPFAVLRALGSKGTQGTSGLYHYFS